MGLVTKAEFVKKRQTMEEMIKTEENKESDIEKAKLNEIRERKKRYFSELSKLSFLADEDDENDNDKLDLLYETKEKTLKTHKDLKNPEVDTSFLPDKNKDIEEEKERKESELRSRLFQEKLENEPYDVIYSYWNGTGHQKKISIRKGNTVNQFLSAVQKQLAPDFREMRKAS